MAEAPSWQYIIGQVDGETVSVLEKIDGKEHKSFNATLGEAYTFEMDADTFTSLLNGRRAMTVVATAANGRSATHTVTFTKGVYAATVTRKEPYLSDTPITKMVMNVAGSIPVDADYQVFVTNNALDDEPAWEDATLPVKFGMNYVFENTAAANGFALNFRINVARGASNTGGYMSSAGGAYDNSEEGA